METTPRRPSRFVAAVALITLACFGGCASTATIERTDGPDNEARLVGSDAGAVYVRARSGQTYRIGRESISDIDHPGNVEILIGGLMIGFVSALAVDVYEDGDRDAVLPLALIYGGPALALIISGLHRYIRSVQAAQAFESAEVPVHTLPPPPPVWMPMAPPPGMAPPPVLPTLPAPPGGPTPPASPAPQPEEPEVTPDPT